MKIARLSGADHTRLGAVEGVAEGRAAIALSRGGASKTYEHSDPNEDSALYAIGEGGTLLAVADGHFGAHGADAAIEYLAQRIADDWCAARAPGAGSDWAQIVYEAIRGANAAVARSATGRSMALAPTTLSVALARPREDLLVYACVGDSHLFLVAGEEARELGWASLERSRTHFLGPPEESWHREDTACGVTELGDARAIVLATDGLSESGIGVPDPARSVADATVRAGEHVAAPQRAQWLARHVVEEALAAQRRQRSGDNIAAAVLWLA